jgi:hypothetical protein
VAIHGGACRAGKSSGEGSVGGHWGPAVESEAVWCSHGAQDGGDEARGGTAWAGVTAVPGGGRRSLVGGE